MLLLKKYTFLVLIIISFFSCKKSSTESDPKVVVFSDANLETIIRDSLNITTVDILETDLLLLTKLVGDDSNISSLSGIEYCENLNYLDLRQNQISDLTNLTQLTDLELLHLSRNLIDDISNIANLHSLKHLYISRNNLSDISSISNLLNLETLACMENSVSDITPLTTLTKLQYIYLGDNNIEDINPLTNLVDMKHLNLRINNISDIEALVNNSGINSGDEIYIETNPLSDVSINTHIPQLESRGVTVHY